MGASSEGKAGAYCSRHMKNIFQLFLQLFLEMLVGPVSTNPQISASECLVLFQ